MFGEEARKNLLESTIDPFFSWGAALAPSFHHHTATYCKGQHYYLTVQCVIVSTGDTAIVNIAVWDAVHVATCHFASETTPWAELISFSQEIPHKDIPLYSFLRSCKEPTKKLHHFTRQTKVLHSHPEFRRREGRGKNIRSRITSSNSSLYFWDKESLLLSIFNWVILTVKLQSTKILSLS